jgi:hypothetical protein
MKFAKLSIAALAVVGFSSSAVALDMSGVTAKPYVKTKLYYETVDTDNTDSDFFAQDNSSGQALATVGVTGSLDQCWGYGLEYNIADTLGLESNLVSGVRMGAGEDETGVLGGALQTHDWASQAYVTYSACNTILSNTTFKIGRQFLDTPLAFTEKWNLAQNSFDAVVVLNQDIKNVTLVGAYVGRGNGLKGAVSNADSFDPYGTTVVHPTLGELTTAKGAYTVGALTNLVDGLPINLWYYNLPSTATAAWADAGYTLKVADDMSFGLGAQYGAIMPSASALDDTSGFGVKIGGKVSMFDVMAAYSSMDDDGVIALANTATMSNSAGGKKTKLYTAGIYTDGTHVAEPGSDAYKVKASAKVAGIGKFIVQYIVNENDTTNPATALSRNVLDVNELDLIFATKFAGIGAKLIYINRDYDQETVNDKQHIRVILSKNF